MGDSQSALAMATAFITGITGQDGGYLSQRLVEEGWEVHGLVRRGGTHHREPADPLAGVTLHDGDLDDSAGLSALLRHVAPEEIYNLGGISSVAYSWSNPLETVRVNALGAAAILETAWQLQQDSGRAVRVLQAGSADMFGAPTVCPQTEKTALYPVSPYGAAKTFAHNLVGVYRARGLFAANVILFNHESPRRPATFVTRKITESAARISAGLQDTLMLGSLSSRRDWGWAPDYVDAMVRAIRHRQPGNFVIATGVGHSVAEFVAAAFSQVGISDWSAYVRSDPDLRRPVEAAELVGDAAKARVQLGWEPTVGFEELVRRMVDADVERVVNRTT
jgi:GDPmannose 4,6-dehydratase